MFVCEVFGHHHLFLVDNMPVCLSFGRYRARSYKLLRQVQRFAAYALAFDLRAYVRWIPSELNSADHGSRMFEGSLLPEQE